MMNNNIDYNKDAITVINELTKVDILSERDVKELETAKQSMNHAFAHAQIFRTDTEARVSVLQDNKFPTAASKYFQCLRELSVQQDQLVYLSFDFKDRLYEQEELEIDLEQQEEKIQKINSQATLTDEDKRNVRRFELSSDRIQNKIDRLEFQKKSIQREALDRKREILMWDRIIKEIEPILEQDGVSTTDPNEHQLLSLTKRYINKVAQTMNPQTNVEISPAEMENMTGILGSCIAKLNQENLGATFAKQLTQPEVNLLQSLNLININNIIEDKSKNEIKTD